jgi:hypothetical protein
MGLSGIYRREPAQTHIRAWRNDPTLVHVAVGLDTWAVSGDFGQLGVALLEHYRYSNLFGAV